VFIGIEQATPLSSAKLFLLEKIFRMAKKIKSKKLESDGNRFQKKMEKAFKQREAKKAKQAKKKAESAGGVISINDT
jgi:hypothetical protein|tara:strand:- start:79 stop:309 length:231 start_codon:yes stop_codon:yes gene_type:complete